MSSKHLRLRSWFSLISNVQPNSCSSSFFSHQPFTSTQIFKNDLHFGGQTKLQFARSWWSWCPHQLIDRLLNLLLSSKPLHISSYFSNMSLSMSTDHFCASYIYAYERCQNSSHGLTLFLKYTVHLDTTIMTHAKGSNDIPS